MQAEIGWDGGGTTAFCVTNLHSSREFRWHYSGTQDMGPWVDPLTQQCGWSAATMET